MIDVDDLTDLSRAEAFELARKLRGTFASMIHAAGGEIRVGKLDLLEGDRLVVTQTADVMSGDIVLTVDREDAQ